MESSANFFDDLDCLSAPRAQDLRDELDKYLNSDPEHVVDAIKWWFDRRTIYPHLSRMAMDYLTIPRKCSNIYLVIVYLLFLQLLLLMWSVHFLRAAYFYHICTIACLLNQRVHFFASGYGASWAM